MIHPYRQREKDLVFCFQNSTNRMGGTLMDTPGGGKDGGTGWYQGYQGIIIAITIISVSHITLQGLRNVHIFKLTSH